jgi:hypothetical protein
MDWLERFFGFSPDGGDGTAEAAIVAICCIILAAVIYASVPRVRNYVRSLLSKAART